VLERITHLNLSHNRLYSMDGVKAFVGVHVLNLAYNRLVSSADISKIVKLRRLATLGLEGEIAQHNSPLYCQLSMFSSHHCCYMSYHVYLVLKAYLCC